MEHNCKITFNFSRIALIYYGGFVFPIIFLMFELYTFSCVTTTAKYLGSYWVTG